MPPGRSPDYAIWRACERFRILPPTVKPQWEDNPEPVKCSILAYSQIRDLEEDEVASNGILKRHL